ncbi:MAG TPA: hypothetical protein VK169_05020 [Saprospiraceae bacterium]|nr:hypothetical protein [Saprospiraceae bacterium]
MYEFETDISGRFKLIDKSMFQREIPKVHWANCNVKGLQRQDSVLIYLKHSDTLNEGDECDSELRFKFRDDPRFKLKLRIGEIIELKMGSRKYGEFKINTILNQKLFPTLNENEVKIHFNTKMSTYLNKIGYDFLTLEFMISNELKEVLASDFITENEMVTLSAINKLRKNPTRISDNEKSAWEYNETKIHIDDFVNKLNSEIDILKIGLEYIKRLLIKLSNEFFKDNFIVILSFYETTYENSKINSYGCGVSRFYKKRNDEFWFQLDKLDEYKSEALIVLETKNNHS